MFRLVSLTGVLFLAGASLASASPCGDKIANLEKQIAARGDKAVATNTGGQAVAAERGAKDETEGADRSADPSGAKRDAGQDFMAAKVSLNEARNADRKGDDSGCEAGIAKAKQQIGL